MFRKNAAEREERKKAKEQDKKYVEFRMEQILRDIKPKSKGFDMKKFDESFPRERRKLDHSEVEFGELMHEYLTLRPDPRFATWFGKRKTAKKEEAKQTTGTIGSAFTKMGLATKNTVVSTKTKKTSSKGRDYDKDLQAIIEMQDEINEEEEADRVKEALKFMDAEDVEGRVKNVYNALGESGEFFWKCGDDASKNAGGGGVGPSNSESEKDKEEPEDAEYADTDTYNRYMKKDPNLVVQLNPYERTVFEPWGPVAQLYNELKVFNERRRLLGNSLESIVRSNVFTEDFKVRTTKTKVTWDETATAVDYVIESNPLEKSKVYKEALGNPIRE